MESILCDPLLNGDAGDTSIIFSRLGYKQFLPLLRDNAPSTAFAHL